MAHAEIGADAATPRLLVGALAPRMLRLAGHHADGTITWMTGPRGLAEHVVPAIQRAAQKAGRADPPEVVVGLPVCVTDDPHAVRDSLLEPMARTAGHARSRLWPSRPSPGRTAGFPDGGAPAAGPG